jgi:hypothetical protein
MPATRPCRLAFAAALASPLLPAQTLTPDTGGFAATTAPWFHSHSAAGDGDVDALVGTLLRNRRRQLEAFLPPRVGCHGELRLAAEATAAGFVPATTLLVASRLAAAPLPLGSLGHWRLDPAATFVHTTGVVPAVPGHRTVRYAVPADPGLLGQRLFAQAVVFHGPEPRSWRCSNVVPMAIRR